MAERLQVGDEVTWNTSQGETHGTIRERLTSPTKIGDYEVQASEDDPQYLVESAKTGARAAHKPSALRKR